MSRKLPVQSEYDAQCGIFEWARMMSGKYPVLKFLSGSLNGVRLTIGQAMKAKKSGMVSGYPDISLPVVTDKYAGLFIELKREKGGSVSLDQVVWLDFLQEQGYRAIVCYGKSAAIKEIRDYLGIN